MNARLARLVALGAVCATLWAPAAAADLDKKYDPSKLRLPALGPIPTIQPERYPLPNGAVVYLLENHDLPLVEGTIYFRATSAWEPAEKVGLAAMTGDVMRRGGTAAHPGDWLDERLGAIGASITTSISADFATGRFRALAENAEEVLGLWAEVLREPAFPEEKLEISRIAQRRAVAARNDEMLNILNRVAAQAVLGKDSPYARNTEYATLDAVTTNDLASFHRLCFAPERAVIAIYGDFSSSAMKGWIEQRFGTWPASGVTPPPAPPYPEKTQRRLVFAPKDDVTQSAIVLAHPGFRADAPDAPDMEVVETALGGGFMSRLFNRVRTERGLAYATGARGGQGFLRPGLFLAYSLTRTDSTLTALGLLEEEVRRIVAEPLSADELAAAKSAAQASFVFNFEQPSQVLFRAAFYEAAGYPSDFLETYNRKLNGTTEATALAAAKQHIHPDQAVVVIIGKESDFERPLDAVGLPVERIDLAIPPPGSVLAIEAATPEALAQGGQWLAAAAKGAGGSAAWQKLSAVAVEREATLSIRGQKMGVKSRTLWAFPDRRVDRLELPFGEMVQASDGASGWSSAMGQVQDQPKMVEQARQDYESSLYHVFSKPESFQVQALSRSDTLDGVACRVAYVKSAKVRDWRLFFRADGTLHGMEFQGEGPSGPAAQRVLFSDWKAVGGLRFPHAEKTYLNGELFLDAKVLKVELNPAAPEASFRKPS